MGVSVVRGNPTTNPNVVFDVELSEVSYDQTTNKSRVNFKLTAYGVSTNCPVLDYSTLAYLYFWDDDDSEYIDKGDTTYNKGDKPIYYNSNTVLYDWTFDVEHNADGKKKLWAKAGFSLFDGGTKVLASSPEYVEFYLELTPLKDTPTVTISIVRVGPDSVTVQMNASESCDKWWYCVKEISNNWILFDSSVRTQTNVTIDGLAQNTNYTVYGSAERTDTELFGISEFAKVKTTRERYKTLNKVILYESTETQFVSNGIGVVSDAISCYVEEERNGAFELEMKYPISGYLYKEFELRRIIFAKPNKYDYPQPFRIYSISRPFNGQVTIKAEHISYDLSGYTVSPFTADTAANAISTMISSQDVTSPFSFETDLEVEGELKVETPTNIRAIIGGGDNSILTIYGGELVFDEYDVKLLSARGEDRGVTIRYGKNLTDINQEENCNNVYTAVRPYWKKKEKDEVIYVELDEDNYPNKIVPVPNATFDFTRILPVDFSKIFEDEPSQADLASAALAYISANNIGIPEVSLTVSFQDLTDLYNVSTASFEEVHLCDFVKVIFEKLNVNAYAECVKTKFDVLNGRYDSIELGAMKSDLASTISSQGNAISGNVTKSQLDMAMIDASKLLSDGAVSRYGISTNYDAGHSNYISIGRLYVISGYANMPIKIELFRRGEYSTIDLFLCFTNVSGNSPSINQFRYSDPSGATNIDAFIYNVLDNRWDIYIKKDEDYDAMSVIFNIPYYMRDRVVVQKYESALSAAPSGAVSATSF